MKKYIITNNKLSCHITCSDIKTKSFNNYNNSDGYRTHIDIFFDNQLTYHEFEKIGYLITKCLNDYNKAIEELQQENEELKRRLNWLAFGNDKELALRYLRKLGYVDFDDKRKCYINKHNNEPFFIHKEEEKGYYLTDDELDEYTKQLEQQNKKLKQQLKEKQKIIDEAKKFLKEFHNYENRFKWCEEDYIQTILKFEEIINWSVADE